MKTRTKLLALVLTLAMLVSVFAAFPVNAASTMYFKVGENEYATLKAALTANPSNDANNPTKVTMLSDYTGSEDARNSSSGNIALCNYWELDGQGFTWTNTSGNFNLRFEGNAKFTNITFDYKNSAKGNAVLQFGGVAGSSAVLGSGVYIKNTGSTTVQLGVMFQKMGPTLTIDGAVFDLKAPAIATWEAGSSSNGARTINLLSGTLSIGTYSTSTGAIVQNGTCYQLTVNYGNAAGLKVNDYSSGEKETRPLYYTDVTATIATATYADGESVANFTPATLDMTKPFYVAAEHATDGLANTYDNLVSAVAALKAEGGTVKLINDVTLSTRTLLNSAATNKTYTIDGKKNETENYTITCAYNSVNKDIIKFEGSANVTITNVTFAIPTTGTANNTILFLGDSSNDTLTLGEGVLFTGGTVVQGVVMLAQGTLNISGAEFEVNGAAITLWGNKTRTLNLNSGVLSRSETIAAIHHGYGSIGTNNTINVNALLTVNDYSVTPMETRNMYATDISSTITDGDTDAVVLNNGVAFDVPKTSWITVGNGATKYYSLVDAVAAANDNDVLTVTGQMIVPSAAVIVGKTLTLQGADATASITASGNFAVMVLHNANVTVATLKLNSDSTNNNGVVTLGDTTSGQVAYTGATLTLNSGAVLTNTYSSGGNTGGNGVSALVANDNNTVTVNTGATITTGGTALRADNGGNLNVTIAGGTVTSTNRGMIIGSGTNASSLTITGGTFSTTNASSWLIKAYHTKFSASWTGGTVSTGGGKVFDESDTTTKFEDLDITITNVTVVVNGVTIYDSTFNATFTDKNMMYLYVDEEKTTAGSGLGFASQVNVNTNADVTYGVLFIPADALGEDELVCDTATYGGLSVLSVTVEEKNNAGFVKAAVTGLTKNMMDTAIVGRAYATVTITIGDLTLTRTVYGEQMSATARDFARAYVRDNQNIDADTQAVVDYFLENGNV